MSNTNEQHVILNTITDVVKVFWSAKGNHSYVEPNIDFIELIDDIANEAIKFKYLLIVTKLKTESLALINVLNYIKKYYNLMKDGKIDLTVFMDRIEDLFQSVDVKEKDIIEINVDNYKETAYEYEIDITGKGDYKTGVYTTYLKDLINEGFSVQFVDNVYDLIFYVVPSILSEESFELAINKLLQMLIKFKIHVIQPTIGDLDTFRKIENQKIAETP